MEREMHATSVDSLIKEAQSHHQAKWGRLSACAQSAHTVAVLASPTGQRTVAENTQLSYPIYSHHRRTTTQSSEYSLNTLPMRVDYDLVGIPANTGFPDQLNIAFTNADGHRVYDISLRGQGRHFRYSMNAGGVTDLYFIQDLNLDGVGNKTVSNVFRGYSIGDSRVYGACTPCSLMCSSLGILHYSAYTGVSGSAYDNRMSQTMKIPASTRWSTPTYFLQDSAQLGQDIQQQMFGQCSLVASDAELAQLSNRYPQRWGIRRRLRISTGDGLKISLHGNVHAETNAVDQLSTSIVNAWDKMASTPLSLTEQQQSALVANLMLQHLDPLADNTLLLRLLEADSSLPATVNTRTALNTSEHDLSVVHSWEDYCADNPDTDAHTDILRPSLY